MLDANGKETKHGGSPESGLVVPTGLEDLKPSTPDGMVLVPKVVIDARKQAEERSERARQLARRTMAEGFLRNMVGAGDSPEIVKNDVTVCLKYADELIAQTGGGF